MFTRNPNILARSSTEIRGIKGIQVASAIIRMPYEYLRTYKMEANN